MRSKKVFDFGVFLAQWETFLDRVLAFDPTGESCSLGRVATAKCSQIPYWSAPSPAILLTVSQPLSSGSAQRARHCGLSKSVLLGAHWRAVCVLSANAFVSRRSDGGVTQLPRGQSIVRNGAYLGGTPLVVL